MKVVEYNGWCIVDREREKFGLVSMLPPRHDPPPPDDLGLRPGSCILETQTYFSNRTNSTTASCKARDGSLLRVTFFIAPPPRVSYLCVCCPTKSPYEQFASEPEVVAAEDDLVLIRMAFGNHANSYNIRKYDFFIYRAAGGGRAPSLTRTLPPKPFVFPGNYRVALLPRYEEDPHLYYIVILHKTTVPSNRKDEEEDLRFDIHIYKSKTASWIRKHTSLVKQNNRDMCGFKSDKAITIGGEGGAVAWVDLWYGFLQCDVLKDTVPMLYYIPLPTYFDQSFHPYSDARVKRDIAMIQGRIKFVQLLSKVFPEYPYRNHGWTVASYRRTAANPWEVGWQQDGNAIELDAKSLSANPMLLQHLLSKLLPEDSSGTPKPSWVGWQQDGNAIELDAKSLSANPMLLQHLPPKLLPEDSSGMPKPSWDMLLSDLSCPLLSLHQDDHVYVMAKVVSGGCDGHGWDGDGWEGDALGLAFDLTTGKLGKVVQVNAERASSGILFFLTHSRISKYLDMDTGSRGKGKQREAPGQRESQARIGKQQHEIHEWESQAMFWQAAA